MGHDQRRRLLPGPVTDRPKRRRDGLRQRQPEPVAEPGRRRHLAESSAPFPGIPGGRARPTATTSWSRSAHASSSRPTRSRPPSARPTASRSPTSPATCPTATFSARPSTRNDPTVVYAVLGGFNGGSGQRGHVFRTTVAGTAWQDISPALDVPFGGPRPRRRGHADDASTSAPTSACCAPSTTARTWTVLDDIHFPRAPVTDLVLSRRGACSARRRTVAASSSSAGPTDRRSR